jgi:transposase-like protein
MMQKLVPTHFKLNYQYREYHLTPKQIEHSKPIKSRVNLFKIYNSDNVLGLVLTFYVSFAMSARKTALVLRMVFGIHLSGQTVLNYAQAAASYCHTFNLKYKGSIDDICSGDETYIKIMGKYQYVWFFISSKKRSIIAYHVADHRGAIPAITTMNEAIRTACSDQKITLITDGNPSYPAGLHYINEGRENKIKHIKVIGLENLDEDSLEYRAFKQIIERLNRTFKQHVRPSNGFNSFNGAVSLTTLFVTHYNFLRSHMALNYKTPIHIPILDNIQPIQAKWIKILSMAA